MVSRKSVRSFGRKARTTKVKKVRSRSILVNRLETMKEVRKYLKKLYSSMTGGEWDTPLVNESPMDFVADSLISLDNAIELTEKWYKEGRR